MNLARVSSVELNLHVLGTIMVDAGRSFCFSDNPQSHGH